MLHFTGHLFYYSLRKEDLFMPHLLGGDFHLCDKRIVKHRPQFKTLKEHDEFICDTVLVNLTKRDVLTMVGDCVVGPESIALLKKFPCYKRLVMGNHDCEKHFKFDALVGVIDDLRSSFRLGSHYNVMHIPCHPLQRRGKVIIHAHMHAEIIPDPHYISVSLERTGYRLVQVEEIYDKRYRTFREPELVNGEM